ncbi:MAG: hypothetical protein IPM85_18490 [Chitinophagaceae bacterium]|nr:hypothetical protein [Chitinophagaceae bacterium]
MVVGEKLLFAETAFYDRTQAVEMEVKFSGISQAILDQFPDNQRTSVEPFLAFTDSLYIKRIQAQPNVPVGQIKLMKT